MRKWMYFICIVTGFISCSKDNTTDPGSLKLTQVKHTLSNSPTIYTNSFGYDAEGRMTKLSTSTDNGTPEVLCTISYSGTEAILNFPANNAIAGREIKYLLNGNSQPVSRIETNYLNNDKPGEFQRSLTIDTTLYTYDGSGRILSENYSIWDSTYFRPSYVWISVHVEKGSKQYSNAGGNAGSYKKSTRNSFTTRYDNNTPLTGFSDMTEDVIYAYDNNWAYPVFGKNAFIYQDFSIIPLPVTHFSSYLNYPNKITQKTVQKDNNGVVTSSADNAYSPKISFNNAGLFSRIVFDQNPLEISYYDFIYSK